MVTRRRLLLGIAAGVGLLGGGVYVARSLEGDSGGYAAPPDQPMVTTRGRIDSTDETDADAADTNETDTNETDANGTNADDSTSAVETTGSWAFDETDEVFLFVHGFGTDAEQARDQAYTAEVGLAAVALAEGRPVDPPPVVGYSWESDVGWKTAKRTADANAEPLSNWLIEWAETDGRPVHLLGYSLGARVTGETLRVLEERGRIDVLASVSLLGGAIPHDSVTREGRYGPAIAVLDAPVWNFHSENDRVLGWVYRAVDRTEAVGHGGISDPDAAPAGYGDVDVTDLVADHFSYFQPAEGCLPRVVERIE